MILFYINLCYNEVSYKGSGRANPGSEFVVANLLAKWKKFEPNEFDFSQGFSKKKHQEIVIYFSSPEPLAHGELL